MEEKIFLWNQEVSAGTGKAEDDFQPYLVTKLLPETDTPAGAVVILPGGGYRIRAPHEGGLIADKFNSLGFHAIVVEYRVAPYTWPAPQQDALRAIAIVRANAAKWNIDPDHIALCGFSAGGHLAASCGTVALDLDRAAGDEADSFSSRPDALLLCYPVITSKFGITHLGSLVNLSGSENPDEEFLRMTSLENQIRPDTPPAFLWHTGTDQVVNVQNSLLFATEMWKKGLRAELHVFPEGNHGLGLAEQKSDVSAWPELAATFLKTISFPCQK